MLDPGTLLVFTLAALALAVVPGPAVLYIVAQSVQGGRARAWCRRSASRPEGWSTSRPR